MAYASKYEVPSLVEEQAITMRDNSHLCPGYRFRILGYVDKFRAIFGLILLCSGSFPQPLASPRTLQLYAVRYIKV